MKNNHHDFAAMVAVSVAVTTVFVDAGLKIVGTVTELVPNKDLDF
jgi:hypothetical protein